MKNRVTYYPVATQRQFAINRDRIRGKAYEKYFDGDLWLHDAALPALAAPIDPAAALSPTPQSLNTLLDPGHHEIETGYCELPDGTAYVASLVPFPGCSGDMLRWWFWWHSVEPARYTLWYPHNHIAANPVDRGVLTHPGLTDEQRYIGSVHHVDEYIGPDLVRIAIAFVNPAELGFDTRRFESAGIVVHACARVSLRAPSLSIGIMVHLARQTAEGFELRSRYWIGHEPRLGVLGRSLPVDPWMSRLGLKRRLAGARVAYEQLLHDQIEFTHLSTFLAALHGEFATETGGEE